MSQAHPAPKPRGSEAVRDALVAAATKLFAQFGPGAVSVREIAAEAQVNHGLVHRHFGSKEALLEAVMAKLIRDLAQEYLINQSRVHRSVTRVFRRTRAQGAYWRILAHSLLEERKPGEMQREFPIMNALVQAIRHAQATGVYDPKLDARAVTAAGAAFGLGWLMFEPFLVAGSGLDKVTQRKQMRELARILRRMELALRPPDAK
jgi:TetR/AcrR family transcriptional regulator, repressor for neighboring sulfatase